MDTIAAYDEANQTFTELLEVLSGIPAEKINTVPFAGSWTAGQCVQHVILSAGSFVELLNGPVIDPNRDPEQNVANLRAIFLNFDHKMQSPPFIVPEDKIYDKQQLIDKLQHIQDDLLKAIQTLDTTKICLAFELPGSGHISRAEAITFANVHTIRHVRQLKNIAKHL